MALDHEVPGSNPGGSTSCGPVAQRIERETRLINLVVADSLSPWHHSEDAMASYNVIQPSGGVPIKAWTKGVPFDDASEKQLENAARLPFIHKWIAAMPDVHAGIGATIGSVIPTTDAIIPAAVGVDLGCGM